MRAGMVVVEGGDGDQLTEKGKARNDRNISDGGEEDDVKFALQSRIWTGSRSSCSVYCWRIYRENNWIVKDGGGPEGGPGECKGATAGHVAYRPNEGPPKAPV